MMACYGNFCVLLDSINVAACKFLRAIVKSEDNDAEEDR